MTALEFAQDNGGDVSLLGPKERQRLLQDWREIFAREVKAKTGKWVHLGYEWHAFSYQFTRSEGGARALSLYLEEAEREVCVIPEDDGERAFSCRSRALLDFSICRTDILVFPPALVWTAVFTHEQPEFGPYFSRAEW